MDTDDTISTLNGLIETCRDGNQRFQEAATNVARPDLKTLFSEASTERAHVVGDLQQEVRSLGGDHENSGSVAAALHRAWLDIEGTLTGSDEATILNECKRGEDSAVEAFRDALATDLPANVRIIVRNESYSVQAMHDRIRNQRDRAAKA